MRFPGDADTGRVILAEGPETALSVWQATREDTWACLGVSNIGNAPLPEGLEVIIARDADEPGSKADQAIQKAAARLVERGHRVRIAMPSRYAARPKSDFNDMLICEGEAAIRDATAAAKPFEPVADAGDSVAPYVIRATPFAWVEPASLPKRTWVYGRHLVRSYLSTTIAPGGFGKSSLITAEAVAMVSGRALLGDQPAGKLRVWLVNLEDPEDELRRRIVAAALHHRISPEEIGDRLFLDSGRKTEIIIATEGPNGIQIAVPVVEAIKAEIIANSVDVLQVDPFVACHAVAENDNTKIAAVVRQWAAIAEATNCAIDLIHHARKGGPGQSYTVEDARGASALIAAVRSARVLNGMSPEEAQRANIENPTSYFSVASGKANLAPRSEKATWRRIVSVSLGNGASPHDPGDFVGAVEQWIWPDPFSEVSPEDAKEVQRRIAKAEWRADQRAENWAGKVVAEVLGWDLENRAAAAAVKNLLRVWISTAALRVVTRKDLKRMDKKFIEVGQWLT